MRIDIAKSINTLQRFCAEHGSCEKCLFAQPTFMKGVDGIIQYKCKLTYEVTPISWSNLVDSDMCFDNDDEEDIHTEITKLTVRWCDGSLEYFDATEFHFNRDFLWINLINGKEYGIPLSQIKWFSQDKERHQTLD